MTVHEHPKAIGGRVLAPPMEVLLPLAAGSALVMACRSLAGIGAVRRAAAGAAR